MHRELNLAARTDTARDILKQFADECFRPAFQLLGIEIRSDQAHAAIDVVSDATGGDNAVRARVCRSDTTDDEAVAPVQIGHRKRVFDNARQVRDVRHLLQCLVALRLFQQFLVGVYDAINAHALHITFRNTPAVFVNFLESYVLGFHNHYLLFNQSAATPANPSIADFSTMPYLFPPIAPPSRRRGVSKEKVHRRRHASGITPTAL